MRNSQSVLWRIKDQLHVTCYFISLLMCSTCFGNLIYPSSGSCDNSLEIPHWLYCSWFDVCWSFGVVRLEWYPCCMLQHVSDINITIIRSLRLFCWITTLVVLFLVRFCCSFGVVGLEWYPCCRLQHVSDINISIIRSLKLFCWITTLVVLFLVRCVLEFRCGWVGVVSVLDASTCFGH